MQDMPKYMFRMKVFVQLMKNKRENNEKCLEFRRYVYELLLMIFLLSLHVNQY